MADLPAPIREFIEALTDETLAPAYLLVADDGGLSEWGGALDSYGITGLKKNLAIQDTLPFLSGILPLDSGNVFLPNVQTQPAVFADVYLFRRDQGTWILLLDATAAANKRRVMQQRTYDISLHATQLEQEEKALLDANSLLELRVREQTRELSETVLRLQQELAVGRRTERALKMSESRFRSLYDSNMIGIVFWDSDGHITEANHAFLSLLGYSEDDLATDGIRWDRITQPTTSEPGASAEAVNNQVSRPSQRQFLRKDGHSVTLLFGASPVAGSAGKQVGFAVYFSGWS